MIKPADRTGKPRRPRRPAAAPGHVTLEVTWWDAGGAERRGRVGLAPDASAGTASDLIGMLRSAAAPGADPARRPG